MKNDKYTKAKEKARKMRLKKRIEFLNTPLKDKIEQGSIMTTLKSMKELADEIEELIGKKQ
jgi:ribosomal protein L17